MDRIIMHIDVNSAFLSWTAVSLLKNGYEIDIRNIPSIIGGDESSRHGIVLASSMPAKKMGVRTAITIRDAKRKCPNLRVYKGDYTWYQLMSKSLFDLIGKYTPDIEILSIDECFLDYSKVNNLYGDPLKFAYKLKKEIYDELGFTVNIGIANNKLCAKMASDFEKPNKVHTLYMNEVPTKLYPLQVDELYGIGKSSSSKLHELNIHTIGDLSSQDPVYLSKYFKNQALRMINSASGIDDSPVVSEREERKGISKTVTLSHNLIRLTDIIVNLEPLVEKVALEIRSNNKYAYVIGVILKDKYFNKQIHQRKLKNATNNTGEIYNIVKELTKESWNEEPVRLIGVSLTNLVDNNNHQISLFENIKVKEQDNNLSKVIDSLQETYGTSIINKASRIKSKK